MDFFKREKIYSGFTLIELSIVLVIISLIVGGIIGGKSLIRAGNQIQLVGEYNMYKVAINNFVLQYDARPGELLNAFDYFGADCGIDANNGAPDECNGDSNGSLGPGGGIHAWRHLSFAGLITDRFTVNNYGGAKRHYIFSDCGKANHGSCPSGNIPESTAYKGSGFTLTSTNGSDGALNGSDNTLYGWFGYYMALSTDTLSGDTIFYDGPGIPTLDAISIDKKVDDGLADSGKIVAAGADGYDGSCHDGSDIFSDDAVLGQTASYDKSFGEEEKSCILYFKDAFPL